MTRKPTFPSPNTLKGKCAKFEADVLDSNGITGPLREMLVDAYYAGAAGMLTLLTLKSSDITHLIREIQTWQENHIARHSKELHS